MHARARHAVCKAVQHTGRREGRRAVGHGGGHEGEALKAFGALLDVIERDAWGALDVSESEEGTA